MRFFILSILLVLTACNQTKQDFPGAKAAVGSKTNTSDLESHKGQAPVTARSVSETTTIEADPNYNSAKERSPPIESPPHSSDTGDGSAPSGLPPPAAGSDQTSGGAIVVGKFKETEGLSEETIKELTIAFEIMKKSVLASLSCETSNDCLIMPYGIKNCGGPDGYFIGSKKNALNTSGISTALVLTYSALSAAANSQIARSDKCSLEVPPVVACVQSKCGPG